MWCGGRYAGKNVGGISLFVLQNVPLHSGIYLEDDKATSIHGSIVVFCGVTPFGQTSGTDVSEEHIPTIFTPNMAPLLPFVVSPNQTVLCHNTRHCITKTHGRETLKSCIRLFKVRHAVRYSTIQGMIINYEVGLFHNCSPSLFLFFETPYFRVFMKLS